MYDVLHCRPLAGTGDFNVPAMNAGIELATGPLVANITLKIKGWPGPIIAQRDHYPPTMKSPTTRAEYKQIAGVRPPTPPTAISGCRGLRAAVIRSLVLVVSQNCVLMATVLFCAVLCGAPRFKISRRSGSTQSWRCSCWWRLLDLQLVLGLV